MGCVKHDHAAHVETSFRHSVPTFQVLDFVKGLPDFHVPILNILPIGLLDNMGAE